jgi:hypothetical protein
MPMFPRAISFLYVAIWLSIIAIVHIPLSGIEEAPSSQARNGQNAAKMDGDDTPIDIGNGLQTGHTSVRFSSPQADEVFLFPTDIDLTVSGLDEAGNVTKVEFFNGQTSLAALTEGPFEFTWEVVPQGIHSLTAKVFTDGSSVVFSDPISIAVLESPPGDPQQLLTGPRLPDNSVEIHLLASPGKTVSFQQSDNLSDWNELSSGILTSGLLSIHPNVAGISRKFYRATSEPLELLLLGSDLVQARPGAIITLQVAGINEDEPLSVRFFNDSGFEVDVPVVRASASEVRVSVPPYYNLQSKGYASGNVNLRLVREVDSAETLSNIQSDFVIEDLPESSWAPGTVTRAFLLGTSRQYQYTLSGINLIDIAADGTPLGFLSPPVCRKCLP